MKCKDNDWQSFCVLDILYTILPVYKLMKHFGPQNDNIYNVHVHIKTLNVTCKTTAYDTLQFSNNKKKTMEQHCKITFV